MELSEKQKQQVAPKLIMTNNKVTYNADNANLEAVAPRGALDILKYLNDAGYEAYLVGGCVRDVLMGEKPHDWDVTTSATPDEMKAVLNNNYKSFDTGLQHGTVTFVADNGEAYEVTTFRVDGEYSDGRHPDDVTFTKNVEDDLARRDFTVNAIAWNPKVGLVDPFDGVEDLKNSVLRGVGDPVKRFHEDGLRVMRAVRFAATKELMMEANTADAVHSCVDCLEPVSRERVYGELMTLLKAKNSEHLFDIMNEYADVVFSALPEMKDAYGYDQGNPNHSMTLWEHSLTTCCSLPAGNPLLRFTGLMHDIGKLYTRSVDENGVAHYYGHMEKGAEVAENACRRLKMSNEETEYVSTLVSIHDFRPYADAPKRCRRLYARLNGDNELLEDCLTLMNADINAHSEEAATRSGAKFVEGVKVLREEVSKMETLKVSDLVFGGNDLMEMGYKPGPLFSQVLNTLLEEVVDGDLKNEYNELRERAVVLAEEMC